MARLVVSGYMLRHPLAGNVLAYLQYVVGLERLGHEVVYVEESGWPYSSYDPASRSWRDDPGAGLAVVEPLMRRLGCQAPVAFIDSEERGTQQPAQALADLLRGCDAVIDVGGVCWSPLFDECRRRVLIDMDPVFTQLGEFAAGVLDSYDVLFSYGTNLGRPGCEVPTGGRAWLPAVPPVIPDLWQTGSAPPGSCFTTIANWGSYGSIEVDGARYGQKDEQFEAIIDLPQRTSQCLELALAGADEHLSRLRSHGWRVRDAAEVTTSHDQYVGYLAGSKAEFSVAKHAYVVTSSGWISDRSVCYLAAGRPVVVQDTGVSDWFDTDAGVVTFRDLDGAAAALDQVAADYDRHCVGACRLARETFSYETVLPWLVDRVLAVDKASG